MPVLGIVAKVNLRNKFREKFREKLKSVYFGQNNGTFSIILGRIRIFYKI